MEIANLQRRESFVTLDGSKIRELAGPAWTAARNQSLAEATVAAGRATVEHFHRRSEEIYYFTAGRGRLRLADEERDVVAGDCVVIPPGTRHKLWADEGADLVLLCACAPAYTDSDTQPTEPVPVDWGLGSYERIAVGLLPAAASVIEAGDPRRGERVLDVGCGTGNAGLLAADLGARVVGVDPAGALLELAVAEAAERGVEATFLRGDAAGLPVADGSADLVVSVFGVIFAPDAAAAAAELARVTAPGGRIVLAAWLPGGVFAEAMKLRSESVAAAGGGGGPPPGAWHDRSAVSALLSRFGFAVERVERTLARTGGSPREFAEAELTDHPVWVAARRLLEPRGAWADLRDRAVELFTAANEDPDGFRVTMRYVIITARRA